MKKIGIIFLGIILVLTVVAVGKDMIIKASVEKGVQIVTGLKLDIKTFKVGIMNTLVSIKQLKLYNPKGFDDKTMVDIPEIHVDYNLGNIIKGNIHLEEVRLNLKEFYVIKNKEGALNLDSLKLDTGKKEAKKEEKEDEAMPQIQIDALSLKVGKVIYKDYSKGDKPHMQEFNVNIDESYQNIDDPQKLVGIIVAKALMNTAIAQLTNFDLGGLKGTVSDTLATAQKSLTDISQSAGQLAQKIDLKSGAGTAQDAVKSTTDALGGLTKNIKLPFGSSKE